MNAKELLNKIKDEYRDEFGVIAISKDEETYWYHVHEDEDLPDDSYDLALHWREKWKIKY